MRNALAIGMVIVATSGCAPRQTTHESSTGGGEAGSPAQTGGGAGGSSTGGRSGAAGAGVSGALTGGANGEAGAAGGSGSAACPSGLAGPVMSLVRTPGGVPYCMDTNEVTQAHYEPFLQAGLPITEQAHPLCNAATNTSFRPSVAAGND